MSRGPDPVTERDLRHSGRGGGSICPIGIAVGAPGKPTIEGMSSAGLDRARAKMSKAGIDPVAIDTFAHYYRLLEHGETGLIRESTDRAARHGVAGRRRDRRRGRLRGAADHGRHQAQRRPRHVDGHGPREEPALRPQGLVVPRRDRPPGAAPAPRPRRPAPADLHEQLPHLDRHHGRARPLRRPPGRRAAAGVPAEPRAQAARRRPVAGQLPEEPRPRVVPARPRRPLHRAPRHRPAPDADRPGLRAGLRLQLRQPRRGPRRDASPAGSPTPARRSRSRPYAVPPPTARAATSPAASPTAGSSCARPRRPRRRTRRRWPTSTGTGSARPTTSGSTCGR